jgi:hypothetical protein
VKAVDMTPDQAQSTLQLVMEEISKDDVISPMLGLFQMQFAALSADPVGGVEVFDHLMFCWSRARGWEVKE